MLRIHGIDFHVREDYGFQDRQISVQGWNYIFPRDVANHIGMLVAPVLYQRVPAQERIDARKLMDRLEGLTCHFRFLDLPAELRNRMYDSVLEPGHCVTIKPFEKSTTGYPPLTKTCQQIRNETLPIFYNTTAFKLDFTSSLMNDEKRTLAGRSIQKWMKSLPSESMMQLRDVTLSKKLQSRVGAYQNIDVRFTFTPQEGLQVQYPKIIKKSLKNGTGRACCRCENSMQLTWHSKQGSESCTSRHARLLDSIFVADPLS